MATRARAERLATLAAAAWIAAALTVAPAACAGSEPRRVLFIGNSLTYVNDLPGIVQALSAAPGGVPLECRAVTAPGFSLEDHWNGSEARAAIAQGGWSFVVLQQGSSALAASRDSLLRDARRFAPLIRKAGAIPALYAVWPSAARRFDFDSVAASYADAATAIGAVLLPVGTAWQSAWKRDPGLALYDPDGLHPAQAASYLAGLVIYQGLSGKSPLGLPSALTLQSGARLQIPAARAALLQEAAAEATRASANRSANGTRLPLSQPAAPRPAARPVAHAH